MAGIVLEGSKHTRHYIGITQGTHFLLVYSHWRYSFPKDTYLKLEGEHGTDKNPTTNTSSLDISMYCRVNCYTLDATSPPYNNSSIRRLRDIYSVFSKNKNQAKNSPFHLFLDNHFLN